MSSEVWKYCLTYEPETVLDLSSVFEPLHVDMQGTMPCLWVRVNTRTARQPYVVLLRGTGQPFNGKEGRHLGTVQYNNVVLHYFEERQS